MMHGSEAARAAGSHRKVIGTVRFLGIGWLSMLLLLLPACDGGGVTEKVAQGGPPPAPAVLKVPLEVLSDPPGAEVQLDGEARGSTPTTIPGVSPGTHRLRLSLVGYQTREQEIDVSTESSDPLKISLEPEPSSLVVQSVPAGATCLLDGEEKGVAPVAIQGIPPGTHDLLVRLRGYAEYREAIDLPPGERIEASVALAVEPRRAQILDAMKAAAGLLEEGRVYAASIRMGELEALPGRKQVLTMEDEREVGYLQGRLQAALPGVSFSLAFHGHKEPLRDGLGPPKAFAAISPEPETTFLDFSATIRATGGSFHHVALLQVKRKKGSIVRVVPHEVTSAEESLTVGSGTEAGAAFKLEDSTRVGSDDFLYCLLVSPGPIPGLEALGIAPPVGAEDAGADALEWARRLVGRLEESEWFRDGKALIRTVLVCMEEV